MLRLPLPVMKRRTESGNLKLYFAAVTASMEMAKEEGPILHSRFRQYPKEDFNIICGE
jgi:hypothetical protein